MPKIIEEQTLEKVNVKALTRFIGLAGVATILPFFIHLQWISGPIINAILILVLFLVGARSALVVALIPSLMALSGGLLPAVLAPTVPFIMVSNLIYIYVIDSFYKRIKNPKNGYFIGLFLSAAFKFIFLQLSFIFISKLLIKSQVILKVAQMLSWSQFFSAVTGGMIAWVILKKIKRI